MCRSNRSFYFTSLLFLLSVLLVTSTAAQFDNNWYFGRKAGLQFGVNGPQVLHNSAMTSSEAAASISDEDGNLLFYSSGVQVFNRNHQLMQNGDNLGGNISACQMSIVPHPGDSDLFYIFTADAIEDDFVNGYRYSIVDISLDGGNGAVISKNNSLTGNCSERLATVRHSNGIYVWLITNDRESDIFRAWLIDCNGLQTNPVVSTVGATLDQHALQSVGVLKASPDGNLLCQTHFPLGGSVPNFVQLFDFDNSTGQITNPRNIGFPQTKYNHCEFSPDSKLLYLTRKEENQLDQLEVTLPTLADILASRVSFPTQVSYYDIQLAVDEKIYLTPSNNLLAVINNPNSKGAACDFRRNVIDLQPGSAFIGLPSHINDIVGNRQNGFEYSTVDNCTGEIQFTATTSLPPVVSWFWDFGDGNTSSLQNPVHIFADPNQVYKVKLTITSVSFCGKITRSRQVLPSGFVKGTMEFSSLNVCDSGYIRFTNESSALLDPGVTWLWDFGDGNTSTDIHPRHTYLLDGDYDVKLKVLTGTACFDDSITHTVPVETFSIQTIASQTISFGQSVTLTTTGPPASYSWTPATGLTNPLAQSPLAKPRETTFYTVTATTPNGCKDEDTVTIFVIPPPDVDDIYVPGAFTPNNDGRNDIFKPFVPRSWDFREFSIYNRWGQRIFTTNQRDLGWDGKIKDVSHDSAVFVWIVVAIDRNGKRHERKGTFVVIR